MVREPQSDGTLETGESDGRTEFNRVDAPVLVEDRYVIREAEAKSKRRARVVNVASTSCRCPSCGALVRAIALPEDSKRAARVALMRVVSTSSIANCKNLQVSARRSCAAS